MEANGTAKDDSRTKGIRYRSWELQVEKIDLTKGEKRAENDKKTVALTKANLKQTVEAILREMKSGRKVAAIADRLGIEQKFVEDVCRIYVTHPGVDAQGIVDRIEVNALRK